MQLNPQKPFSQQIKTSSKTFFFILKSQSDSAKK